MQTETFRTFYNAIEKPEEKKLFKKMFLNETKLSDSSFENYKKISILKEIRFMYSEKIIELANKLFPKLVHLLIENQAIN